MAFFLPAHSLKVCLSLDTLISGSLSSSLRESVSIPKKTKVVEGPSTFAGATGRPSSEQSGTATLSAVAQSGEVGGAQNRMSSRQWIKWRMPQQARAHASPSATAVKMTGADLSPNGRA